MGRTLLFALLTLAVTAQLARAKAKAASQPPKQIPRNSPMRDEDGNVNVTSLSIASGRATVGQHR